MDSGGFNKVIGGGCLDRLVKRQIANRFNPHQYLSMIIQCAWCNCIRDDHGQWQVSDKKMKEIQECKITHTICLECLKNLDPELHKEVSEKMGAEQSGQRG